MHLHLLQHVAKMCLEQSCLVVWRANKYNATINGNELNLSEAALTSFFWAIGGSRTKLYDTIQQ